MLPEAFVIVDETRGTMVAEHGRTAGTSKTRRRGLLGMSAMPAGLGLWIAPCEAIHTFWMQFPIDVVFLSREKQAVKLVRALKPWRISLCLRAHSVLELEAGAIDRSGLSLRDQVRFQTS